MERPLEARAVAALRACCGAPYCLGLGFLLFFFLCSGPGTILGRLGYLFVGSAMPFLLLHRNKIIKICCCIRTSFISSVQNSIATGVELKLLLVFCCNADQSLTGQQYC
ncbi:hypothetical protein V6Z11_D10G250700 [Gossypium hirsutum]